MTARVLPRELGVVIACNEGDLEDGVVDHCPNIFKTALIMVGPNRVAAEREGWIRGGAKAVPGPTRAGTSVRNTRSRSVRA